MRHFLKETDFNHAEAASIFELAAAFKTGRKTTPESLKRESWGLLFYKSSTRTRVSFEVGINELGGFPIVLNVQHTQIGRGETIADTSQVLSRYLHGLVIRTYEHAIIEAFARHADMPVINALTDLLHPCQSYADYFTLSERWSGIESLRGRKLAFLGDSACNMANSLILGGQLFGVEVVVSGPAGYAPGPEVGQLVESAGLKPNYHYTEDPAEAVRNADVVYTDVWVSMGSEDESAARKQAMRAYQVTPELMRGAKPDAYFMHCLPAHADEEVTQTVLDSQASIIFDQAENRLHMQKAILTVLAELNGSTVR